MANFNNLPPQPMSVTDIIKSWLKYAEYNPEKAQHNLFSIDYEFHKVCETVKKVLPYDPEGIFSLLYIKSAFARLMKEAKVSAFDVLSTPEFLHEEIEMWQMFHSDVVTNAENQLCVSFNELLAKITPNKMIGQSNRAEELNTIMQSIEVVVESLPRCNEDLFKRGGLIQPITHFSPKIHLFDRLSECLLAIEVAPDGMYLCYIDNGGTADGYFSYFIKSNGTILSVNESVKEAFPGEHKGRRNARWSEKKQYDLFPYAFIFSYAKHDYKGIATEHHIDEEMLSFHKMEPEAYMPLVISFLMLNVRYTNMDPSSMRQKYVDALLPVNLALPTPGTAELMVPSDSQLALIHESLTIDLTEEDVLGNKKGQSFDWKFRDEKDPEYPHDEYGHFYPDKRDLDSFGYIDASNFFIKLYGEGFKLDHCRLLEADPHLKRLTSTELAETSETPNVEFVGTQRKMELIAYMRSREQLAEYLKDRIFEEYTRFGGVQAMKDWWRLTLIDNKEKAIDLCLKSLTEDASQIPDGITIRHQTDSKGRPTLDLEEAWRISHPYNQPKAVDWRGIPIGPDFKCCECSTKATEFFVFRFEDWKSIQSFVGEESVPKILKGWHSRGHNVLGNSILCVTDAVTGVGTPFEYNESTYNPRYNKLRDETGRLVDTQLTFSFWIGFSKRVWNRIKKERC